jgi:hypothetical protein
MKCKAITIYRFHFKYFYAPNLFCELQFLNYYSKFIHKQNILLHVSENIRLFFPKIIIVIFVSNFQIRKIRLHKSTNLNQMSYVWNIQWTAQTRGYTYTILRHAKSCVVCGLTGHCTVLPCIPTFRRNVLPYLRCWYTSTEHPRRPESNLTFMAVKISNRIRDFTASGGVAPCSFVKGDRCFRRAYYFRHQGDGGCK